MIRRFIMVAPGLILILSLLGCSDNGVDSNTDQAAILALIGSTPDLTGSDVLSPANTTFSKASVDTVKMWWRQLLRRGRVIGWGVRQPADSANPHPYLLVTLTDTLEGQLHILGKNVGDTTTAHLIKPFTEVATRKLLFQKRGPDRMFRRGWVLAGLSGIELASVPNTAQIDSVKIENGTDTKVITDILQIVMRPHSPGFSGGDSVQITVYTGDATDSVYLHAHHRFLASHRHIRRRTINNGDGSFSAHWIVPNNLAAGRWHFGVDVLKGNVLASNITDDYDSRQWGVVYRVGVPE
jgi:hypothetical protein